MVLKTILICLSIFITIFSESRGNKDEKKSENYGIKNPFIFMPYFQNDSSFSKQLRSLDSEDSINDQYLPKWYNMITNLPNDMVRFYDKEITIKNIPMFLGISAATAGLILTDNNTWKASHKFYNTNSFNKRWSDIIVKIGDGSSQFGLAGGFMLYGFIAKDNRALRTASEIVEAVLASGAVVQLLKHITGRESPFISTKPAGAWRFFPNQIDYLKHVPAYDAFPSGHMTTSLAAFIVIAENYPELTWIKPVSYSLEVLLGISMVNTGIHWYSDYPLAIFLGYSFGELISHPILKNKKSNNSESTIEVRLSPYYSNYSTGLSLSVIF